MDSPSTERLTEAAAAERQADVLEAFLDRAGIEGERAVTRLRLILCVLGLCYQVSLDWSTTLPRGYLPDWIRVATFSVAIGYSLFFLRYLRGRTKATGVLQIAAVLDPLVVFGLIVPGVIDFSNPDHPGVLRDYAVSAFILTAVSSGVRMSLGAAKLEIAASSIAFAVVVALDQVFWAGRLPYTLRAVVWPVITMLGASVFGWDLTKRMRRLVIEGANAMLVAERAKDRLRSYVSPGVAEDAMRVSQISMTGHQVDVAVLFSDLRGFTAYAERLAPHELVIQLNAYFEAMLVAIAAEGGTVDKYIGDAIMVVFDDAARAIRTASAMQLRLATHNVERGKRGLTALRQGIGIHFGSAIAGNVGTPEKLQHTVMGDVVNVASRLEGATKTHQTTVFISKETVEAARRIADVVLPELRVYGKIEIAGRDSEVDVFTLDEPSATMSIPPPRARTA